MRTKLRSKHELSSQEQASSKTRLQRCRSISAKESGKKKLPTAAVETRNAEVMCSFSDSDVISKEDGPELAYKDNGRCKVAISNLSKRHNFLPLTEPFTDVKTRQLTDSNSKNNITRWGARMNFLTPVKTSGPPRRSNSPLSSDNISADDSTATETARGTRETNTEGIKSTGGCKREIAVVAEWRAHSMAVRGSAGGTAVTTPLTGGRWRRNKGPERGGTEPVNKMPSAVTLKSHNERTESSRKYRENNQGGTTSSKAIDVKNIKNNTSTSHTRDSLSSSLEFSMSEKETMGHNEAKLEKSAHCPSKSKSKAEPVIIIKERLENPKIGPELIEVLHQQKKAVQQEHIVCTVTGEPDIKHSGPEIPYSTAAPKNTTNLPNQHIHSEAPRENIISTIYVQPERDLDEEEENGLVMQILSQVSSSGFTRRHSDINPKPNAAAETSCGSNKRSKSNLADSGVKLSNSSQLQNEDVEKKTGIKEPLKARQTSYVQHKSEKSHAIKTPMVRTQAPLGIRKNPDRFKDGAYSELAYPERWKPKDCEKDAIPLLEVRYNTPTRCGARAAIPLNLTVSKKAKLQCISRKKPKIVCVSKIANGKNSLKKINPASSTEKAKEDVCLKKRVDKTVTSAGRFKGAKKLEPKSVKHAIGGAPSKDGNLVDKTLNVCPGKSVRWKPYCLKRNPCSKPGTAKPGCRGLQTNSTQSWESPGKPGVTIKSNLEQKNVKNDPMSVQQEKDKATTLEQGKEPQGNHEQKWKKTEKATSPKKKPLLATNQAGDFEKPLKPSDETLAPGPSSTPVKDHTDNPSEKISLDDSFLQCITEGINRIFPTRRIDRGPDQPMADTEGALSLSCRVAKIREFLELDKLFNQMMGKETNQRTPLLSPNRSPLLDLNHEFHSRHTQSVVEDLSVSRAASTKPHYRYLVNSNNAFKTDTDYIQLLCDGDVIQSKVDNYAAVFQLKSKDEVPIMDKHFGRIQTISVNRAKLTDVNSELDDMEDLNSCKIPSDLHKYLASEMYPDRLLSNLASSDLNSKGKDTPTYEDPYDKIGSRLDRKMPIVNEKHGATDGKAAKSTKPSRYARRHAIKYLDEANANFQQSHRNRKLLMDVVTMGTPVLWAASSESSCSLSHSDSNNRCTHLHENSSKTAAVHSSARSSWSLDSLSNCSIDLRRAKIRKKRERWHRQADRQSGRSSPRKDGKIPTRLDKAFNGRFSLLSEKEPSEYIWKHGDDMATLLSGPMSWQLTGSCRSLSPQMSEGSRSDISVGSSNITTVPRQSFLQSDSSLSSPDISQKQSILQSDISVSTRNTEPDSKQPFSQIDLKSMVHSKEKTEQDKALIRSDMFYTILQDMKNDALLDRIIQEHHQTHEPQHHLLHSAGEESTIKERRRTHRDDTLLYSSFDKRNTAQGHDTTTLPATRPLQQVNSSKLSDIAQCTDFPPIESREDWSHQSRRYNYTGKQSSLKRCRGNSDQTPRVHCKNYLKNSTNNKEGSGSESLPTDSSEKLPNQAPNTSMGNDDAAKTRQRNHGDMPVGPTRCQQLKSEVLRSIPTALSNNGSLSNTNRQHSPSTLPTFDHKVHLRVQMLPSPRYVEESCQVHGPMSGPRPTRVDLGKLARRRIKGAVRNAHEAAKGTFSDAIEESALTSSRLKINKREKEVTKDETCQYICQNHVCPFQYTVSAEQHTEHAECQESHPMRDLSEPGSPKANQHCMCLAQSPNSKPLKTAAACKHLPTQCTCFCGERTGSCIRATSRIHDITHTAGANTGASQARSDKYRVVHLPELILTYWIDSSPRLVYRCGSRSCNEGTEICTECALVQDAPLDLSTKKKAERSTLSLVDMRTSSGRHTTTPVMAHCQYPGIQGTSPGSWSCRSSSDISLNRYAHTTCMNPQKNLVPSIQLPSRLVYMPDVAMKSSEENSKLNSKCHWKCHCNNASKCHCNSVIKCHRNNGAAGTTQPMRAFGLASDHVLQPCTNEGNSKCREGEMSSVSRTKEGSDANCQEMQMLNKCPDEDVLECRLLCKPKQRQQLLPEQDISHCWRQCQLAAGCPRVKTPSDKDMVLLDNRIEESCSSMSKKRGKARESNSCSSNSFCSLLSMTNPSNNVSSFKSSAVFTKLPADSMPTGVSKVPSLPVHIPTGKTKSAKSDMINLNNESCSEIYAKSFAWSAYYGEFPCVRNSCQIRRVKSAVCTGERSEGLEHICKEKLPKLDAFKAKSDTALSNVYTNNKVSHCYVPLDFVSHDVISLESIDRVLSEIENLAVIKNGSRGSSELSNLLGGHGTLNKEIREMPPGARNDLLVCDMMTSCSNLDSCYGKETSHLLSDGRLISWASPYLKPSHYIAKTLNIDALDNDRGVDTPFNGEILSDSSTPEPADRERENEDNTLDQISDNQESFIEEFDLPEQEKWRLPTPSACEIEAGLLSAASWAQTVSPRKASMSTSDLLVLVSNLLAPIQWRQVSESLALASSRTPSPCTDLVHSNSKTDSFHSCTSMVSFSN